jgi:hypothetical protein
MTSRDQDSNLDPILAAAGIKEGGNHSDRESKTRQQRVYEQLGAPSLLYRHLPTYQSSLLATAPASSWKIRDVASKATTATPTHYRWFSRQNATNETLKSFNRVKTRWNYPLDQQDAEGITICPVLGLKRRNPDARNNYWTRPKRAAVVHATSTPKNLSTNEKRKEYNKLVDQLDDADFIKSRTVPSMQAGRLTMLLEDEIYAGGSLELLENYSKFDHPYMTTPYEMKETFGTRPRLVPDRFETSLLLSQDRRNGADPCYLAPMSIKSLEISALADNSQDEKFNSHKRGETNISASAVPYGNCILCLPCPCTPCTFREKIRRSWCLFHPIGELLDRISVSNLIPPLGEGNGGNVYKPDTWRRMHEPRREKEKGLKQIPNELDVGDTILEIKQCGSWEVGSRGGIFIVRTSTHVNVLKVSAKKPVLTGYEKVVARGLDDDYDDDVCWGNYHIQEISRLDLRSLSRSFPSYRPISVACHPKYGNSMTSAKFAFVSHSDRKEFNVIHHVMATEMEPSIATHTIANLSCISLIDFTSTHPMCLWSAARSYVSPALASDSVYSKPYFGRGSSLFTVDLRTDTATFQWSPSAEEFLTEGVHSISAIMTDWLKEQTVWVSSISAGKTWEIDGRMPCRAVNVWSLTSSCDQCGTNVPANGENGDGILLTQPLQSCYGIRKDDLSFPVLSVEKTPGAYGVHIYQRPQNRPRFQTKSLECIATPGLAFNDKTSIATSSVFALPDVSNGVFTCGLSTLRTSLSQFLADDELEQLGYSDKAAIPSVLCAVTLTNKGDIYTHSLLESTDTHTQSQRFADLPLGSSAIAIPDGMTDKASPEGANQRKVVGGMNLHLRLNNQYPTPFSAISPPLERRNGGNHLNPHAFHWGHLKKSKKRQRQSEESEEQISDPEVSEERKEQMPDFKVQGDKKPGVFPVINEGKSSRGDTSIIPQTMTKNPQERLASYSRRFEKDRKSFLETSYREEEEQTVKSDLSRDILEESMSMWDKLDEDVESKSGSDNQQSDLE